MKNGECGFVVLFSYSIRVGESTIKSKERGGVDAILREYFHDRASWKYQRSG